jgi:O-antigen/teichoic acid export membrane protein
MGMATGDDLLRTPQAGRLVIRGAAVRGLGYGTGVVLAAVASVFLLRHLGVEDFGRFATVMSLVAIVSGITDAGLTAVGARDLPLRPREAHPRLLANLLGLRLLLTPLGVLGAAAFAVLAGYDDDLVLGTLLAGAGLVLINAQATMMMPLQIQLRIGRLTLAEVLRQALTVVGIVVLVAAGASLLPFFALPILVGAGVLAASPLLVGPDLVLRPAADRREWRGLLREALPIAASLVMNVIYFRVLIILLSLLATARETGLFATSFRIFEVLFALPTLVLTVALPVLAVAHDDRPRLRYVLQRMTEVSAIAAVFLAILIVIVARPMIELLGGSEYADAAPILRIQGFALGAVFLGQVWQLGLISIRRQSALVLANGVALALVVALGLALIPAYDATGAAVAAVVAESALAATLFVLIARADASLRPDLGFLWKPALAGGLMAACLLVPGVSVALTALLGTAVYALAIWLTRALPAEVLDAFRPGSPAPGG